MRTSGKPALLDVFGKLMRRDHSFLAKGMPELDNYLHYRIVGTSPPRRLALRKQITDLIRDITNRRQLNQGIDHVFNDADHSPELMEFDSQELAKRWYPGDVARRGEESKERFISHR